MNTVAYDHQIFTDQQVGGVSRYFCEIASRVPQQAGWRSRIIAPLHYNDHLAESAAPLLGTYLPMRWGYNGRIHRLLNKRLSPLLLRAVRADLLHRTYYSPRPTPPRGRLVITVFDMIHELFPQHFPSSDKTGELKRRCVSAADHLICISHSTAEDLVRILDVPRSKITVTHLGYSESISAPFRDEESQHKSGSRPYLLFVGRRHGYKNFARLLEVYAASSRLSRDFDLVAFGGVPFTAAELQRVAALKLRDGAVRRETGSDADLALAYAGAHAFVYPSEYEGFGMPPLEAMSRGCPVACSSTSSIPEVVGAAGEYFDPSSIDSIRSALERLAYDDSRREALIRAGHAQREMFSWNRCASETVAAYSKILTA